jgi:hypothetical protein
VLEKALYEIRYELNSRPDWADIPIRAVLNILGTPYGPSIPGHSAAAVLPPADAEDHSADQLNLMGRKERV